MRLNNGENVDVGNVLDRVVNMKGVNLYFLRLIVVMGRQFEGFRFVLFFNLPLIVIMARIPIS